MLIKDTQDLVARARALAPMVEAAADRTEKERKIPADVLSAGGQSSDIVANDKGCFAAG